MTDLELQILLKTGAIKGFENTLSNHYNDEPSLSDFYTMQEYHNAFNGWLSMIDTLKGCIDKLAYEVELLEDKKV